MVNQLASAFEQQLLTKGSAVRLVVGGGEEEGGGGMRSETTIKLVVMEKSSSGGKEVDVGCVCYGHPLSSEPSF